MNELIEKIKKDKNNFPVLSKWAKNNPQWLKETLQSMAKAQKISPGTAAALLESDLEHQS
jgi:hypothetical protein